MRGVPQKFEWVAAKEELDGKGGSKGEKPDGEKSPLTHAIKARRPCRPKWLLPLSRTENRVKVRKQMNSG